MSILEAVEREKKHFLLKPGQEGKEHTRAPAPTHTPRWPAPAAPAARGNMAEERGNLSIDTSDVVGDGCFANVSASHFSPITCNRSFVVPVETIPSADARLGGDGQWLPLVPLRGVGVRSQLH